MAKPATFPPSLNRLWARIYGTVQGVGFRWHVLHRARTLELNGWVRNRADGSVEVIAEGPRPALASLLKALRQGPAGARVTRVEESWAEVAPEHEGFEIYR
ncbi:MAG: acylphosphatase [Burkholderiales bacterium]|jgi:acylphosphatase|nr:acylphosphatase [Burkholderiales bacterium]